MQGQDDADERDGVVEASQDDETRRAHSAAPRAPQGTTGDVGRLLRRGAKSALARWVVTQHRRRITRPHAPQPRDEATHAWDGRRRFAEDYTFSVVQPGLGIVARLEWLPGRDANRLWLTVLRDGVAFSLPGGQLLHRGASTDRWRAGGMTLDCLVPLSRWSLRYTGHLAPLQPGGPGIDAVAGGGTDGLLRCNVDLTFVAAAPPYTPGSDDDPELLAARLGEAQWDRALLRSVRRVTNRGYVQLGAMHGTIVLGDEVIPVRASALRQHFWGVRDWGASDHGFQCFIADAAGGHTWIHHARFPFVTIEGGFQSDPGGHATPVKAVDISWESRPQRAPAHATIIIPDANRVAPIELTMCSDSTFVVDGRGLVALGLARVAGPGGGWALWGGQRRWLPRR
ncbi:MAG: hypothetical protein JKY37_11930 [Nannocystaceae bacterium]|nr:hypothetical protein [Nannocystaceae bacterium]